MTILSVAQQVALKIGVTPPTVLYTSIERTDLELQAVAAEAAARIRDAHDWQGLKKLGTFTGNGTTTAFDVPSDFHRLPKEMHLWSSSEECAKTYVASHDRWLELDVRSFDVVEGMWTYLGGQILIKPAMSVGETAKFYYQRNTIVRTSGGTLQADFIADTDSFVLDERLLKLAMIWEWKSSKNLPYAEDMANYEYALSSAVERDRGPRILAVGKSRMPSGVDIAYPRRIPT